MGSYGVYIRQQNLSIRGSAPERSGAWGAWGPGPQVRERSGDVALIGVLGDVALMGSVRRGGIN